MSSKDDSFKIKYIKLQNSVIVSYGNFTVPISNSDPRYLQIIKAIDDKKLETIPKIVQQQEIDKVKDLLKIKKS